MVLIFCLTTRLSKNISYKWIFLSHILYEFTFYSIIWFYVSLLFAFKSKIDNLEEDIVILLNHKVKQDCIV